MAIDFEIVESANMGKAPGGNFPPVMVFPSTVTRLTAAGEKVLEDFGLIFEFRNLEDTVLVKIAPIADAAAPTASDGLSTRMTAGQVIDFMLPYGSKPTDYKVVIA